MYDSPEELLRGIRLGEDTLIELKAVQFRGDRVSAPRRDGLADELAAIANTRAGVLVLGVDDETREIDGIPLRKLDAVERYVNEICNESIKPPVVYQSYRMELPDSTGAMQAIFKIDVPHSFFVHESPGGYFHRKGSSKRKLPPEHLARLFQQRSQPRLIRFEEQPVPGSSIGHLSESLWHRYTTRSDDPSEVVLHKRCLLTKDEDGTVCASVAGILLCSEHPDRFLPNARIEAVRYRGVHQDSNYQMDAQGIRGPLDEQIRQAMSFLKRNQRITAVKRPHREETPQFSERAVFEAIVNAVAHRDYSVHGPKIRFFLFDDRLEIHSPGSFPNTLTVDNVALRQSTRNELIVSLLTETPVAEGMGNVERGFYMEACGDGVPIILRESRKLSGRDPVYRLIDDAEVLLTIYSA